jgi:hypothetical protein
MPPASRRRRFDFGRRETVVSACVVLRVPRNHDCELSDRASQSRPGSACASTDHPTVVANTPIRFRRVRFAAGPAGSRRRRSPCCGSASRCSAWDSNPRCHSRRSCDRPCLARSWADSGASARPKSSWRSDRHGERQDRRGGSASSRALRRTVRFRLGRDLPRPSRAPGARRVSRRPPPFSASAGYGPPVDQGTCAQPEPLSNAAGPHGSFGARLRRVKPRLRNATREWSARNTRRKATAVSGWSSPWTC